MKLLTSNPGKFFWRLIFPAGSAMAMAAQLGSTSCGLGLTFDSQLYLEGAAWFNGDVTGRFVEQVVFQAKPPLFPLLLSWFSPVILPFVYAFFLLINLFLLGLIISRLLSGLWRIFAFLAIALFAPMIMVHVYLWTEPLFLVMLYSAVLIIIKAGQARISQVNVVTLAILAVLMILTRHVGLFFVFGIGLALALRTKEGWKQGLAIILPALVAFGFWNFAVMEEGIAGRIDTLVSPLTGGTWSRLKNFQYFAVAAATWFVPNLLGIQLKIAVFTTAVALITYGLRKVKSSEVKILLVISVVYYLFMHVSFLIDESSADRYLVPIYPLIIIACFKLLGHCSTNRAVWLKYLVVLWLFYPAYRTIKNTLFWQEKICLENKGPASPGIQDNSPI